MTKHKPCLTFLSVFSLLAFVVTLVFNYLAGVGKGIFENTIGNVSEKYHVNITPAGYTFSIWGVIYIWLAAMLIYCQSTNSVCRLTKSGRVHEYPLVLTSAFFAVFIINMACNVGWLILWDRELLTYAVAFIFMMALTVYFCLYTSHRRLYEKLSEMRRSGLEADILAVRILVHNGLATYATWVTVATLLNLTMVLVYIANLSMETACIASLSILSVLVITWFILENFLIDVYVRYTLTVYPVLIWALIGVLTGNWNKALPSSMFALVLTVIIIVLFIVRVILVIVRSYRKPIIGKKHIPLINNQ